MKIFLRVMAAVVIIELGLMVGYIISENSLSAKLTEVQNEEVVNKTDEGEGDDVNEPKSTLLDDEDELELEKSETTFSDIPKTTTVTTFAPSPSVETGAKTNNVSEKPSEKTEESKNKNDPVRLVNSQQKTEEAVEPIRYGTVWRIIKTYTLDTYSDGSTNKRNETISKTMDVSGFSATTSALLPEATILISSEKSKTNEILSYVNQYRKEATADDIQRCRENGSDITEPTSPVVIDTSLNKAAMIRALELAYTGVDRAHFSHTRPNGNAAFSVLNEITLTGEVSTAGENLYAGNANARTAAESWKKSLGHYCNMINGKFKKLGVGYVSLDGSYFTHYWSQMFTD